MNRKFLFWSVVMACCAGSVLTSCSDDTVPENSTPDAPGTGAGTYVVAATVDGVNYLLTAESLDEGSVTVKITVLKQRPVHIGCFITMITSSALCIIREETEPVLLTF